MADSSSIPHKTALNDLHRELGAKLVDFAGFELPVSFPLGVKAEHLHTRQAAGLFDVSHMGQLLISGANAAAELARLIPIDVTGLAQGQQCYGLLTNATGGIIDDLIVTRTGPESFYVVINAARIDADLAHLRSHLTTSELVQLTDQALIALQGPKAADVMARICPAACALVFMQSLATNINGVDVRISRCGYTGEDGFELSIPNCAAVAVAQQVLAEPEVEAIGLGARDSLRLEAGLCLYGQDIDMNTSIISAGLGWSVAKTRRESTDFIGSEHYQAERKGAPARKRVGLLVQAKTPVRGHTQLADSDGNIIGEVTSGGFGPTLNQPVAMGYIDNAFASVGTEVVALVRGKKVPVLISKMPFVSAGYFRG
jgi:aminomethyltransferase